MEAGSEFSAEKEQQRALLATLIGSGETENTVANYGTSVENFISMIKAGSVPKLGEAEQHDYYFTPHFKRLHTAAPAVSESIRKQLTSLKETDISQHISHDSSIAIGLTYARVHALCDYLSSITGVPVSIDGAEAFIDELDASTVARNEPFEEAETLIAILGEERAAQVAEVARKRQGVLLFFNEKILQPGLTISHEAEMELVLDIDTPLSLDVLAGVYFPSDEERDEAFRLVAQS